MPVSQQQTIFNYVGTGVATAFNFSCRVLDAGDLKVTVDGVLKALGADYSITGVGASSGGAVVFNVAPANLAAVRIYRSTQLRRNTDYQVAGDFLAPTVNDDFDRSYLLVQDLVAGGLEIGNTLRVVAGDTMAALPAAAARAGYYLGFDGLGQPALLLPAAGTAAALATTLAASAGSANVGFAPAGTGSVARSLQAKLRDSMLSLHDFTTLDPSTVVDWTPAINLAIAYMNVTFRSVYVPLGDHPFSDSSGFIIKRGGFVGAGVDTCSFSTTSTNGRFFQVGDDAAAQFACIDVKLTGLTLKAVNGTAAGQTPAIQVKNAFRTRLCDLFMQGVGKGIWINGTNVSVDTYCKDIGVAQSFVNEDCFRVENGNVTIFDYCKPYVNTPLTAGTPLATPTPQSAGAAFACRPAAGKSCDTFKVLQTCESLYFFDGCAIDTSATGAAVYNVWLDGTFDSNVNAGLNVSGAFGTTVQNLNTGSEFWATSYNGYGVRFAHSGVCDTFNLDGHVTQTGADGMYLGGTLTNCLLGGIAVDSVGRLSPGNYSSVVIAGSAEAISIGGGSKLGGSSPGFSTWLSKYCVDVQRDILRLNVVGNNLTSTTKGINHFAYTAGSVDRVCARNSGDSANLGLQSFTLPASTVAYTNKSAYQQDIYLTGGTLTAVSKNSNVLFSSAGNFTITLAPGETMAVTYTVAPTAKMFQR